MTGAPARGRAMKTRNCSICERPHRTTVPAGDLTMCAGCTRGFNSIPPTDSALRTEATIDSLLARALLIRGRA